MTVNNDDIMRDMLEDDYEEFDEASDNDDSELIFDENYPYGDVPTSGDEHGSLIDDLLEDDEWDEGMNSPDDSVIHGAANDSAGATPERSRSRSSSPQKAPVTPSHSRSGQSQGEQPENPVDSNLWVPERLKEQKSAVDSSEVSSYIDPAVERADPIEEKYVPSRRSSRPTLDSDARTPLEKWSGVEPDDSRPRWVRDTEAMQKKETEFFLNAGTTMSVSRFQRSPIDDLRGPIALRESTEERKKRMKKIARIVATRDEYRRGKRSPGFSHRDQEILEYLAMFRMAKTSHIANLSSCKTETALRRMSLLREKALVFSRRIVDEDVWFLTEAGIVLSGYDVPPAQAMSYTMASLPHYYGINHVSSNLWSCNFNVLNEDPFPVYHRRNNEGKPLMGETMVSEHFVRSSLGKIARGDRAEVYRPVIMDRIDKKFKEWESAGGPEFGPSPEMVRGNEYMWVLYPPSVLRHAFHVADLIVQRERNPDGTPNSIAVEVELTNKSEDSYRKILQSFYHDRRIFGKVVWICKRAGTARKLERMGEEIGLLQEGRLEVIPFLRDEGTTRGMDFQFI